MLRATINNSVKSLSRHRQSPTVALLATANRRHCTGVGSYSARLPVNWGKVWVPEEKAYVVERFGKFLTILSPGMHMLVPVIDRVTYVHSLKEELIKIPQQTTITQDNVIISMDGILFIKVTCPKDASYGVHNVVNAIVELAQTTMRCELGKLKFDMTFENRVILNERIVVALNEAAKKWGIICLRYEIKDIIPTTGVKSAMDKQGVAECEKRAQILLDEGEKQANINEAYGKKAATILTSQGKGKSTIIIAGAEKMSTILAAEATKQRYILESEGEAYAILAKAEATSKGIALVSKALQQSGGVEAASLKVAEQYVEAFGNIAKEGTTMFFPSNNSSMDGMVAQGLAMYKKLILEVSKDNKKGQI